MFLYNEGSGLTTLEFHQYSPTKIMNNIYASHLQTYEALSHDVAKGTKIALDVCSSIFKHTAWNCFVEERIKRIPAFFGRILPGKNNFKCSYVWLKSLMHSLVFHEPHEYIPELQRCQYALDPNGRVVITGIERHQ